jgi:hypothetical protein
MRATSGYFISRTAPQAPFSEVARSAWQSARSAWAVILLQPCSHKLPPVTTGGNTQ